tara:strand:+ start:803 stop:1222 length:420 start_codon:yes stop_codon:yes gene_type:complete
MSKDDILNKLLTNTIEITNKETEHFVPVWWVKQVINELGLDSPYVNKDLESHINEIKEYFNEETNIIFSEPKIIDDVEACDVTFKKNNVIVIIDEFKRYHIINADNHIKPTNNQYNTNDVLINILKFYLNYSKDERTNN